jgi:glycosyltransferase involved in cell wall biosynthesis
LQDDEPAVAVVVPARDAAAVIDDVLAALGRQEIDLPWEVVVVDDGSRDDTAARAEAAGARVVRRAEPGGAGAARNDGVRATRAPLIAFTDADCAPGPGWLAAGVAALADADLVQGPVRPPCDAEAGVFDRLLRVEAPSPLFETANLLVRRDLWARVGGFRSFTREAGGGPWRPPEAEKMFGEDVWFGWRALRAGARRAWAEEAEVIHAVTRRGPRGLIAERARLRYFPGMAREVPELRSAFYGRVFLSRRTAAFDAALAGAALGIAVRRPLLLAAAIPYARHLRRSGSWRRRAWRENAGVVAADAAGLLALLRGSVAARRLVL